MVNDEWWLVNIAHAWRMLMIVTTIIRLRLIMANNGEWTIRVRVASFPAQESGSSPGILDDPTQLPALSKPWWFLVRNSWAFFRRISGPWPRAKPPESFEGSHVLHHGKSKPIPSKNIVFWSETGWLRNQYQLLYSQLKCLIIYDILSYQKCGSLSLYIFTQ